MLATSDLWFRYQDEPVLKGLNLDFRSRLLPVWWARTAVGSLRFYEPERPVASAKGAVLWQGKPLDYSKRGLLALRQQVATVFQDPEQQIFILISIATLRLVYVIWGCRRRKSRAASTRR